MLSADDILSQIGNAKAILTRVPKVIDTPELLDTGPLNVATPGETKTLPTPGQSPVPDKVRKAIQSTDLEKTGAFSLAPVSKLFSAARRNLNKTFSTRVGKASKYTFGLGSGAYVGGKLYSKDKQRLLQQEQKLREFPGQPLSPQLMYNSHQSQRY